MSSSSSRGPYSKSEDTRARVLQAALEEADAVGLTRTSITNVAQRAGVAVGVVNYHFGSKKALMRELMNALVQELASNFPPPNPEDDFFSHEKSATKIWFQFLKKRPTFMRLAEESRFYEPELYQEGIITGVKRISERFRRGIERGDLKPMSESEALNNAYSIYSIQRFADRLLEQENFDPEKFADDFEAMLRKGLA